MSPERLPVAPEDKMPTLKDDLQREVFYYQHELKLLEERVDALADEYLDAWGKLEERAVDLQKRVSVLEAHFKYHDDSFHEMMVEHGYEGNHELHRGGD